MTKPRYDPLDGRQRLAATILMAAVDLPQPAGDYAKVMIAAAKLTPGCTVEEAMIGKGRQRMLERARALIDEMLADGA